jgi:predicted RecB family nuclease
MHVIFQAALEKLPFRGYADFLVKVPGKSLLGNYHYEVWDTKLSKKIKPYFVIQLCCYADMLEDIQGCRPESIVIILGNNERVPLRTDNYFYYYKYLKKIFLSEHQQFNFEQRPDPSDSASCGRWENYAKQLLVDVDHLSQIATITKSQIKKLNRFNIRTMRDLIDNNIDRVTGVQSNILSRLRAQASIQKDSIGLKKPLFKILTFESNQKQGLALLPPHSASDVFFDIEGYPLEEGGLEYLWGCTYFDFNGERQFKDFWAHNRNEEQKAFKEFIEWVYARWEQDHTMHIYHYANYEIAACRKLMGRYGICEYEVDQLLRNDVFVDLYKIVKGGVLLGEPKYSIKNVEHLYRESRKTDVGTGSDSVVVYENWRENSDGQTWETSKLLNSIREYNIDDCNSTQELVDWLRDKQTEYHIEYIGKKDFIEPEVKEEITARSQLRDELLKCSENLEKENPDSMVIQNFAWSLEFHRRENKPVFWRLFDRRGMDSHELLDDYGCLANCDRTEKPSFKPTLRSRNLAYEYAFNPNQEFKAGSENYYVLGEEDDDGKNFKVKVLHDQSNFETGIIVLQAKKEPPKNITLIPDEHVPPEPIPAAIYAQAKEFIKNQLGACAILDFLQRNTPRIHAHLPGQPIAPSHEPKEKMRQIVEAVINLDNSYLVIQGPPGAGKTFTGKHIIVELLKLGKKIGICSNSHKAINHLLISTANYCKEINVRASFICTKNTEPALESLGVKILDNAKLAAEIKNGCVVGTTAWGFAREDLADMFDYLFIDEAGQVSVANLIAISRSTKNIILMGDQMQLSQPTQGSHPAESGLSTLDYLLHDKPTIPENLGVFLETTYRMHSAVNQFISSSVYEGKLAADLDNDKQIIKVPNGYSGIMNKEAGIIFVPVEHEGNTQASDEEVSKIQTLAHELLGRVFINKKGESRPINWSDILFVAPYNYQVNKLREALGKEAKVGSVDKFQGQEAPIVFLSMCASNAGESPRGLDFLFDIHRLNVAISRAQSLAVVVANPHLCKTSATNIQHMEMTNMFCRLMQ